MTGYSQDYYFGLKGGVGFYSLIGKNVPDNDYKSGMLLGLTGKIQLKGHLYLQPELYYEVKGASKTIKNTFIEDFYGQPNIYIDQKSSMNYNYIIFPVLLNISLGKKEIFYLNGGPFIGFLTSVIEKIEIYNSSSGELLNEGENNFKDQGSYDQFNKIDVGLNLGGGTNIKITKYLLAIVELIPIRFLLVVL